MMDLGCLDEGWLATGASGEWEHSVQRMILGVNGDTGSLAAELTKDRSWVLLSWVESVASDVASGRGADRVPQGIEALNAVLQAGYLDYRDVFVAASLLRWAVESRGIDWRLQVDRVRQADQVPDLRSVSGELPPTFEAIRDGAGYRLQRLPDDFDLQALRRRLGLE